MKFASLLIAALIAAPVSVATGGIAMAQEQDAKGQVDAELLRRLSVIPDGDVADLRFIPTIRALYTKWGAADALKTIAALDAEMRDLFWISFLREETFSGGMHQFLIRKAVAHRQAEALRKSMVARRHSAADIDARVKQLLSGLDDTAQHAPAIADALSRSGLARQHRAFVAAQALATEDPEADFSGLNADFGTQADLREAIDAYRARAPAIAPWIAQVRHALSDDARLWHLRRELEDLTDFEAERLPKPLRIIHCIDRFNAQISRGTFSVFFYRMTGDHAPETVVAMRALGLKRHADALQRGIDMIGEPYPTDRATRQERWKSVNREDLDQELVRLTVDIDETEITPALLSLAKRQGLLPR